MSAPLVSVIYPFNVGLYNIEFFGRLNPLNSVVTYYFEYDIDVNFNTSITTAVKTLVSNSIEYLDIKLNVDGLIADTTYYYRLVASNIDGTSTSNTLLVNTLPLRFSTLEVENNIESEKFRTAPLYRDFNQFSPDISPFIYNVNCVAQGLHNILHCNKRELFFKNDFGSDTDSIVFKLIDEDTIFEAEATITEPIALWEPRAYLSGLSDIVADPDNNLLGYTVNFGLSDEPNKTYPLRIT